MVKKKKGSSISDKAFEIPMPTNEQFNESFMSNNDAIFVVRQNKIQEEKSMNWTKYNDDFINLDKVEKIHVGDTYCTFYFTNEKYNITIDFTKADAAGLIEDFLDILQVNRSFKLFDETKGI